MISKEDIAVWRVQVLGACLSCPRVSTENNSRKTGCIYENYVGKCQEEIFNEIERMEERTVIELNLKCKACNLEKYLN